MPSRAVLPLLALLALQLGCDPLEPDETDLPLLGKIVFSAKRDSSDYHQIYTVNADGTDLQQVTFFAGDNAYYPSWSPAGDEIVFVSDTIGIRDSGDGLFTVAADWSSMTQLKKDSLYSALGDYAEWSPTGNLLAIYSCGWCRSATGGLVTIRDLDQGWAVGFWGAAYPAWSSDGAMLASVDYDTETEIDQIFIFAPNFVGSGGPDERLTVTLLDKKTPVWSPDDTRIAFISGVQLLIHNLGSDEEQEMATEAEPANLVPYELHTWVGDEEEHLLVTYVDKTETHDWRFYLYAVNVQSGAVTLIVPDSTVRGADWHLPQ